MSAAIAIPAVSQPTAVAVRSGWRRAVLAFTILGAGCYAFGRQAAHDSSGTIPPNLMIMSVMFGPMLGLAGFGLWYCLLGDGSRRRRVLAVLGVLSLAAAAVALSEKQMRFFVGMWGFPLATALTGLILAVVPVARRWPAAALIGAAMIAPWLGLRADGVDGMFELDTSARWKPSVTRAAAEHFADRANVAAPTGASLEAVKVQEADWPGFRGANRTGVVPAVSYQGWDGQAPRQRWRNNPVGPAWSSFCVVGDRLYTQEQRGDSESVVCYEAGAGKELWARGVQGKHDDLASGPGPRATPTYADGRVFAVTAAGSVCALRAGDGELLWQANLNERFGAAKPVFGLSTSPLVVGAKVILNPASKAAPRLVALDVAQDKVLWQTEAQGTDGYSSPQLSTIGDVAQVLIFNGAGLFGHDPETGRELWRYDWATKDNEPTTVQPMVLPDGRIVFGGGNVGVGTRCIKVERAGADWKVAELWRTPRFTPKFNDVVRVGENLFGLDAGRLVCLDLATGAVRWKEGDYGAGQLLLVGDKLLIATEKGKLACVAAKPEEYEELWRIDAVAGKTWNHPALARGRLYFRNTTEMAAFDLVGWAGKE